MTRSEAVLITGASSGIGLTYAERFARRGYALVLVARDAERLEALARRLRLETGVEAEVIVADLTKAADLAAVEQRLRSDERINILVNNAGAAGHGGFADPDRDEIEMLIRLNVLAPSRLAAAVVPRFLAQGNGSMINIGSVLGLIPEIPFGVYGATKSFVLTLSQSLQAEPGPRGIYVQAVLPTATRTAIWERSGRDIDTMPAMMDVGELVDAALVGFDRRELVTIPPLPELAQWDAFEAARRAMVPNLRQTRAAERYQA